LLPSSEATPALKTTGTVEEANNQKGKPLPQNDDTIVSFLLSCTRARALSRLPLSSLPSPLRQTSAPSAAKTTNTKTSLQQRKLKIFYFVFIYAYVRFNPKICILLFAC
jgi:hypothetical protein